MNLFRNPTRDLEESTLDYNSKVTNTNIINIKDLKTSVRCVCFDLDGTLVDTLEDIVDSVNKALQINNLPTRTSKEITSFIGNGSQKLIELSVGEGYSQEVYSQVYADYLDYYKRFPCVKAKAYKGIINLLRFLYKNSYYMVVITNKPQTIAERIIEKLFPEIKFDLIMGDIFYRKRKPDPSSMRVVKRTFVLRSSEIIMIGDSTVDFKFAQNANVLYYSFTHGYNTKAELEEAGVANFLKTPTQLISVLHQTGCFKEKGRLILSIFAYLVLFCVFFIDLSLVVQYQDKHQLLLTFVLLGIFFGIILMLVYFLPYALRKSYLNLRLFLVSFYYFCGSGSILSSIIAAKISGEIHYPLLTQSAHMYVMVFISAIFLFLMLYSIARYFWDIHKIRRREKHIVNKKKMDKIEKAEKEYFERLHQKQKEENLW